MCIRDRYLAACAGDLEEIVKVFKAGSRINGYFDNNNLTALGIAKQKGFTLVSDWLSAEEKAERNLVFQEWLESDERKKSIKLQEGIELTSDASIM